MKIIKSTIKFFLSLILKRENSRIKNIILDFKTDLDILDIGATGGIQKKWNLIEKILNVIMVEPNKESFLGNNNFKSKKIISKLLSSESNKIQEFNITQYDWCSSIAEPNFLHINKFKGSTGFFSSDSYKVVKKIKVETTTIDNYFENKELDFIKIDAEGHHYEIIQGANNTLKSVLGLEVECEFFQLRKDQKIYFDVINQLKNYNFEFIDFLVIHRWERDKFRFTGQPQHTDILFLKKPEDIINELNNLKITEKKLLKYIIILVTYNRSDLIKYIINNINIDIVKRYNLDALHSLIEAKVVKLNKISQIEYFFKSSINNEI